jgi:hypothetical protein
MKSKMLFFFIVALSATVLSCSDDDEVKRKGDADITHEGAKWTITSSDYTLLDQSTTVPVIKYGTDATGTFYLVEGGTKGSFEMDVAGYNKEDAFTYSIDQAGSVSIMAIEQSAGTTTNQNILALSGDKTSDTEITLDGTITKQTTSGGAVSQFVLTISVTLTKQ